MDGSKSGLLKPGSGSAKKPGSGSETLQTGSMASLRWIISQTNSKLAFFNGGFSHIWKRCQKIVKVFKLASKANPFNSKNNCLKLSCVSNGLWFIWSVCEHKIKAKQSVKNLILFIREDRSSTLNSGHCFEVVGDLLYK